MILAFWKSSIKRKDWLHVHLATYLIAPEQHKLFTGAISIFDGILDSEKELNLNGFNAIEDALGIQLDKLICMAAPELGNKLQTVRKISSDILIKISNIAGKDPNPDFKQKIMLTLGAALKPLKASTKEPILGSMNKELAEDIRKLLDEKTQSPDKGLQEEEKGGLIYAEPMSEEMKQQVAPVFAYFSEHVTLSLYSQNWAARYAGMNKVIL